MSADPIAELGFELVQRRRDGSRQYGLRANPYLNFWLVVGADGTAQFSWEFALGEYLSQKDLSVSAQDALSLLLFPRTDATGPAEPDWIRERVDHVMALLGSVDLAAGT